MSANPIVFGISMPIDMIYLGAAIWWVYRDAQLPKPDESMRRLRRWNVVVTACLNLWQLFVFWPWKHGDVASHVPAEIFLAGMLLSGYWLGYLWVGDWCSYYFTKFHTPFPNVVYYASGVGFVVSGIFAALRVIVPFLLDDLWLFDLFFLIYIIPLIISMGCCAKLAWDVRQMTKQKYIRVMNAAAEEEQALVTSKRRVHMCKVNLLIVYFVFGMFSTLYWVPVFIQNLSDMKPGTPLHTRPEMPLGLVVGTSASFWIPYGLLLWYTKFTWASDPLDMEMADEPQMQLDTMTQV